MNRSSEEVTERQPVACLNVACVEFHGPNCEQDVERCGKPIRGLYGADTVCAQPKHQRHEHTSTSGIWRGVVPVAGEGSDQDEHKRRHDLYGTWPCAWKGGDECPIVQEIRGSHDVPARCEHGETSAHEWSESFLLHPEDGETPLRCPGPAAVVPATTEDEQR